MLFSVYPHGNVWSKMGKSDNLFLLFTAKGKFYSIYFPNSWPAVMFYICSVPCWHCKYRASFRREHQKIDCFLFFFFKSTFCCLISIHNVLCVSEMCTAILHDRYWKQYKAPWVNSGRGRAGIFPSGNIAQRYKSAQTEYTQILKHNSQSTASPKLRATVGFMISRSFMHHPMSCKNMIQFLTGVFCSQD